MVEASDIYAVCILKADGGSGVNGYVKLFQKPGQNIQIKATFTGLKAGLHGFHIHQYGNLLEGCKTAGGHYNPFGKNHGGLQDEDRHVGDLGNVLQIEGQEQADFYLEDHLVKLDGPSSVIGRSFVIHADEDDNGRGGYEDSKTTGHAGARLACGTIGLSGPFQF